MKSHDGALSAIPYRLNLGLANAAISAGCHFADLGGNNTVVRQELALAKRAEKKGVAFAPDCGLSPGMASILWWRTGSTPGWPRRRAQTIRRRSSRETHAPFQNQLVFSVE